MPESRESKKEKSLRETAKKSLEAFLAKPDEPGISYEEQNRLQKESARDPEAGKKFIESKRSKYRINALSSPLMAAEAFLKSSESGNIEPERKQELAARIEKAFKDAAQARERKLLMKEDVEEVVQIAKELLPYLES